MASAVQETRKQSLDPITNTKRTKNSKIFIKKESISKQRIDSVMQPEEPTPLDNVESPLNDSACEHDYKKEIILEFFSDLITNIVDSREIMKQSDMTLRSDIILPQKSGEDVIRLSLQQSLGMASVDLENSIKYDSRFTVNSLRTDDKDLMYQTSFDDSRIQSRKEVIHFKNGNIYEGEIEDGIMHGDGTFTWLDGTRYEGEFVDGYPTGKGIMTLPDLGIYEGEVRMGNFHGNGVYNVVGTPMFYKGEWKSGKMHGQGWLYYDDGDSYEGKWSEGLRHGQGLRKYKNGARYKGEWQSNKKHGNGTMVYENNDYYCGTWQDNLPHGYGEYFWDIFFNETLAFPIYNWFKGSWTEGLRNGAGILDLGMRNGAKIAGIWKNNFKHGPGVIICGNGMVIEKNPLFKFDKPAHKSSIEKNTSETTESTNFNCRMINCFSEIFNLINKQEPVNEFSTQIVINLNKRTAYKTESKYIKFASSTSINIKKMWHPLKLSMGSSEEVDLTYYMDIIFQYFEAKTNASTIVENSIANKNDDNSKKTSVLQRNEVESNTSTLSTSSNSLDFLRKQETLLLKNMLTIYLPKITNIYDRYATISCDIRVNFKPVLVRLFLWQFYRDVQMMHLISLVDIDSYLYRNPYSCYETQHNPFEYVYLWQFIQALVACAWISFITTAEKSSKFEKGWVARIFQNFMEHALVSIFIPAGQTLTQHKNCTSIKSLYELYVTIGEPHSARQFFQNCYVKRGKEPPCYFTVFSNKYSEELKSGKNAVTVGNKLEYINDIETKLTNNSNDDALGHTLFTLRTIGRRKILNCLTQICPRIGTSIANADLSYKLTFLEFFEIVLLCAFEKSEEMKLKSEMEMKRIALEKLLMSGDQRSIMSTGNTPRVSKLFKKKRYKKSAT